MNTVSLPQLPEGKIWDVREFFGNEIQWYGKGQRLEVRVLTQHRILGFKFCVKDYSYPTYLIDPLSGEEGLLATAALILEKHAAYEQRLLNSKALTTPRG